jgi:hypothetical protein
MGGVVGDLQFVLVLSHEKNVEANLNVLIEAVKDTVNLEAILEVAAMEGNVCGFKHMLRHFPVEIDLACIIGAAVRGGYLEICDMAEAYLRGELP